MDFILTALAGYVLGVFSMVALALVLVVRKRREIARAHAANGASGAGGAIKNAKITVGESAVAILNADDPARRSVVHNL